jgi:hypothetical protein
MRVPAKMGTARLHVLVRAGETRKISYAAMQVLNALSVARARGTTPQHVVKSQLSGYYW